jgi:hypothetical protein
MPFTAATEAARLSVAPMMDGGDLVLFSIPCRSSCAQDVHASIALSRVLSR